VNHLFAKLCGAIDATTKQRGSGAAWVPQDVGTTQFVSRDPLIPGQRTRYLAEIAANGRSARAKVDDIVAAARRAYGLYEALRTLHDAVLPSPLDRYSASALSDASVEENLRTLRTA
jgi:methylmalonyl-CoA mutase